MLCHSRFIVATVLQKISKQNMIEKNVLELTNAHATVRMRAPGPIWIASYPNGTYGIVFGFDSYTSMSIVMLRQL